MATIHASSAVKALRRFGELAMRSHQQSNRDDISVEIAETVQIVAQVGRFAGGRKVSEIIAVRGYGVAREDCMFLREEQRVLTEQLKRKSTPIADMYYGGLRSFADEENPYRFHLAAHAFRELISHCAQLTGETVVYGDGMKSRLKPVKEAYQEWKRTSSLGANPTTNVVGLSEDLMVALESFFDWQESNRPEARKKTAMMLTQLSGAGPALPSDVVANEISGWMKADEYFKAVAHNKHKAKQDEFIGKLFLIEDILLRRMSVSHCCVIKISIWFPIIAPSAQ